MKKTTLLSIIIPMLGVAAIGLSVLSVRLVRGQNFIGPTTSAGLGQGAIGVNGSGNLSIGTSTTQGPTKLLIVASSSVSTNDFAVKILQANASPVFVVRDDGAVGIATSNPAYALDVVGTIRASGSLLGTFSGNVAAANVTTGLFNGGQYNFPSSVAIATGTALAGPQTLSVYGGGYFSGSVGIGTSGPVGTLQVSNGTAVGIVQAHVANFTGSNYSGATIGLYDAAALAASTGGGINFGGIYTGTSVTEWARVRGNKNNGTSGDYGGSLRFATRANGGSMTDQMMIDSSGNVGIGTSTPAQLLHVYSGAGDVRITADSPAGNFAGLQFQSAGVNKGGIFYRSSDGDRQQFWVGGLERLSIASSGNVGIATTTPTNPLSVQGNANISGALTVGSCTGCGGGGLTGGAANYIPIWTSATAQGTSTIYQSGGNIGIGTSTPVLDPYGSEFLTVNAGTAGFSEIGSGGNTTGTSTPVGAFSFFNSNLGGTDKRIGYIAGYTDGATNSGALIFDAYNAGVSTEWMRITHSGNVGIGTTGPTDLLDVNGNIGLVNGSNSSIGPNWGMAYFGNGFNNYLSMNFAKQFGVNRVGFRVLDVTTGNEPIFVGDSDNVGIGMSTSTTVGTSPSIPQTLSVFGGGYFSGSVGIATTSPAYALDVVGTIRASGSLLGTFAGTVPAANVTTGLFNGGQYNFPSSVAIATGTALAGPQTLSVYGGGYFSGSVGIGTTGPTYPLQVDKNGSVVTGNWVQVAEFRDSTPNKGISLGYDSSSQTGIISTMSNSLVSNLAFWTYNGSWGERVRIDSSGNVGIGTSTPSQLLHVFCNACNPRVMVQDQGRNSNVSLILHADDAYSGFNINVTSSSFSISGPGGTNILNTLPGVGQYVGIGVTNPAYALDIGPYGTMRISANPNNSNSPFIILNNTDTISRQGTLRFQRGGTDSYLIRTDITGNGNGTANLGFYDAVAGAWRMLIDGSGNVGIGTTGPLTKLHTEINDATAYANVVPTVTDTHAIFKNTAAGANVMAGFQFNINDGTYNRVAYIGGVSESATNRNTALVFDTDEGGSRTEKMRITGAGNVGIGTTGPTTPLYVNGNVTISTGGLGAPSPQPTLFITSTQTGHIYGIYNDKTDNNTVNNSDIVEGDYSQADSSQGVNYSSFYGVHGLALFTGGAGTLTNAIGVLGGAQLSGAGSITSASGVNGIVQISGGTIGTAVAIRASSPTVTAGTITTAYGVYIETQTGGTTNYSLYVNGTSPVFKNADGGASWSVPSDVRLKTDIHDLTGAIGVVNNLHPVKFHYKSDLLGPYHYNFIAQEYQKIFPQDVSVGPDGYLALAPNSVLPYLVAADQEFSKVIRVGSNGSLTLTSSDGVVKVNGNLSASGNVAASGLELRDKTTGAIYCVSITNGELNKTKGACD